MFLKSLSLVVLVTAIIVGIFQIFPPQQDNSISPPWQVSIDEQGQSTVFGLTLGKSTLAQAKKTFADLQIAIISDLHRPCCLEAYVHDAQVGGIKGKMVLTTISQAKIEQQLKENSHKREYLQNGRYKFTIANNDLELAKKFIVSNITFIPTSKVDENTLVSRFGKPTKRITTHDKETHLLYPKKGIDIAITKNGKNVIQYVRPHDFSRIQQPLKKSN